MTRYAEGTTVPVVKSRAEIEKLLSRHKCSQFQSGVDYDNHRAVVQFKAHARYIKFEMAIPNASDPKYRKDRHGWALTPQGVTKKVEQAERQMWRALLLVIKAKLEAVENGISTFEDEFLAHIVLPDQRTVGEYIRPAIEQMYETGRMLPTTHQLPAKEDT